MLKYMWKEFIGLVSDIWNASSSDVLDNVLNKTVAFLVVTLAVIGIGIAYAVIVLFVCNPVLFLYAGVPLAAIYLLTKFIVAQGEISRKKQLDEEFKRREELMKEYDKSREEHEDNEDK